MFTIMLDNLEMMKETDMNFSLTLSSFHGPAPTANSNSGNNNSGEGGSKDGGNNANASNNNDENVKLNTPIFAHVTGMDVCSRKPLLVTCGVDRSVRIWNYTTKKCELVKFFADEPSSVSMHPSGLHVLVGFTDKLRMMNLLMDDIRIVKEFPIKSCRESKFSVGGHYFAAVNGNAINVYTTYTCELVNVLRGHNSRVNSLRWTHNDQRLLSAGKDGGIYSWNYMAATQQREGESVLKGCQYTSVTSNVEGNQVFAVGSDSQVKAMEFQGTSTNTVTELTVDVLLATLPSLAVLDFYLSVRLLLVPLVMSFHIKCQLLVTSRQFLLWVHPLLAWQCHFAINFFSLLVRMDVL